MPDRHCKQIFAMLSEYLDGELPVKNCRQLERHLKGCQPCIAYLESLKTTVEACRRYKAPRAPALSKQAKAALLAAVRQVISVHFSEKGPKAATLCRDGSSEDM